MKKISLSTLLLFPLLCAATGIYGSLASKETKAAIPGVVVILCDTLNSPISSVITNIDGAFGFDLTDSGQYNLLIMEGKEISQQITNIPFEKKEPITINFLVSSNKNNSQNGNMRSAKALEKTPSKTVLGQLNGKNGYFTDGKGELKSITSGGNITYIIDGQVSSYQAARNLVPGSIEQAEIKAR
jgi:hypothetical protein